MLCACKAPGLSVKQSTDTRAVQQTLLCCKHLHVLVACLLCTAVVLLSDVAPPPLPLFLASAIGMPCMLCLVYGAVVREMFALWGFRLLFATVAV